MKQKLLVFWQIILLITATYSARILVVLPTPVYSHNLIYSIIYKELALRGHEVVVFTPNPLNDPKLTNLIEIDMSFLYDNVQNVPYEKFFTFHKITLTAAIQDALLKMTRKIFMHPKMKKMVNDSNERFDLLLVEWNVNPSFGVLSKIFDCPIVGMRSLGLRLEGHDSVGNPTNPSYIPVAYMDFEQNFWGHLDNFLTSVVWRLHYHWSVVPKAQEIVNEFFPDYSTNVLDIEKNVSLILTNTHPIITGVRPLVPAIIEIGGIHLKKQKGEIPKDIQQFLDESKEGVVYFNMGSQIKASNLDPAILNVIISALSELPYKVLWKWDKDNLQNSPLNIKIWKWLPQEAILEHPNVKAFINHGGLLSVYESIDNYVPMVVIPIYGDHHVNARNVEKLKIGKRLDITALKKKTFVTAVKRVVQNPTYKRNIKKVAEILHDLPMKPLEKAVWWIEYVLRHKGAHHLRSAAVHMNWITYLLLDVMAFVLIVSTIVFVVLCRIIKYLYAVMKENFSKVKTE